MVEGCADPLAANFSMRAEVDNGTCEYPTEILEGTWMARETQDSITFKNFYTIVTKVDLETIMLDAMRSDPPSYHLDTIVLRVQWDTKKLDQVETTISGEIVDRDNFFLSYVYYDGTANYVIRRSYARID